MRCFIEMQKGRNDWDCAPPSSDFDDLPNTGFFHWWGSGFNQKIKKIEK